MIHELTLGHLDPALIRDRLAVAVRPLDETIVTRVLAEFPGLKIESRDGCWVVPWHGREDGECGEAFAARLQSETGCIVIDRRNGRVVEFSRTSTAHRTLSTHDGEQPTISAISNFHHGIS